MPSSPAARAQANCMHGACMPLHSSLVDRSGGHSEHASCGGPKIDSLWPGTHHDSQRALFGRELGEKQSTVVAAQEKRILVKVARRAGDRGERGKRRGRGAEGQRVTGERRDWKPGPQRFTLSTSVAAVQRMSSVSRAADEMSPC